MDIKFNAISNLIKEEIKKYESKIETADVGQVGAVGDGIATVYGLESAVYGELIIFNKSVYGMVMNLEEHSIGCVLLGESGQVNEGDLCQRTGQVVAVPVGDALLGRVVNALGQPVDGLGDIETDATRPVEMPAPAIMDRQTVDESLATGIKAIDSMIPIGKGQRELLIGDRQTGKTALAIDTIINQKDKKVICIYCAIGQKNSSIAQIVDRLKRFDALAYTVVVNASAAQPTPMLYLAPYAAVSMAEYWMLQGKDVLVVYDDLSKHAVAYRTLSLLLRRSPGREAYPGDIFYLHSRLLERSCHLKDSLKGGSITSLPIVETLGGDISSYIPTNVISITDGQIFLDANAFNAGQRPAIDSGLSVSRVGSMAQTKAMKSVAANLRMELANYREMLDFARFGSDLDKTTKRILTHGAVLMEVLKQKQYAPLSLAQQVIDLYVAQQGLLDAIPVSQIHDSLKALDNALILQAGEVITNITKTGVLTEKDGALIKKTFVSLQITPLKEVHG